MKKFIKKIKSNKLLSILSVLIIGVFFILIARVTYAYLAPVFNSAKTDVMGSSDTVDDFKFELGEPLKIDATPTTLKENGTNYVTSTTAKALLKANSTKKIATYNYYVYFQIVSNNFKYSDGSTPEIILTVTNPNGDEVTSIEGLTYGTFNGVSGFDVTTKSGLFNIANSYEIISNSSTTYTTQEWNITLTYLNLSIDQSVNFGNSMGVNVYITKNEKILLTDYVISQYTGTQGDNGLYYHNSSLTNGAGDNSYRYAGANPNNFVCFGTNESPCPTDNLYRIIGVFDENYHGVSGKQLVKLIKYDYANNNLLGTVGDYSASGTPDASYYKGSLTTINTYYWNYKADTANYNNTWSTSLLNKTNLNTNFINNIGTDWSKKIATTTWKVGGGTIENIRDGVPARAYQYEVGSNASSTTYEAKIGLMYASDYGFGAVPEAWTTTLYNYDGSVNGSTIRIQNWMYMGYSEWTISRTANDLSRSFFVGYGGGFVNYNIVYNANGVRVAFNLEPTVTYVSGTGIQSDPIIID